MTKITKLLRTCIFIGTSASIGHLYYNIYGCPTGDCLITSNPLNTMLYMGLVGWLLSEITDQGE